MIDPAKTPAHWLALEARVTALEAEIVIECQRRVLAEGALARALYDHRASRVQAEREHATLVRMRKGVEAAVDVLDRVRDPR